jgi:preprotein translocase subunit YajC
MGTSSSILLLIPLQTLLQTLLQAEGGPPAQDYSFFVMMGLIFVIFYALVMRPQQKQQKERDALIKSAVKGDRIVTNGGLHGVVSGVSDETLTVEVARVKGGSKVEVEVSRSGVSSVVKAGTKSEGDGGS